MKKRFWLLTVGLLFHSCVLHAASEHHSDVPLLSEKHLNQQYWLEKLPHNQTPLLSVEQIALKNQHTFSVQTEMAQLSALPDFYSAEQLTAIINAVSSIPASARFDASRRQLTSAQWQRYRHELALETVKPRNIVQFGLVTKRTLMRAFPTQDRVFNQEMNQDLDRFQETGLFPAEPVVILHQSANAQWLLVQNYHYQGWVTADSVAIGSKEQVLSFTDEHPFIVVTGATVRTAYNPDIANISELQLDMGVRLPLLSAAEVGFNVHGQNPAASYIVKLPLRQADGSLAFTTALIPRNQDITVGYLPFTQENIIRQAFKFLGERYGWGHDYNGRDCTGFVTEIYRTFGLLMPRNSGQQGNGAYGSNIRFTSQSTPQEKMAALQSAKPGDLIYLPGHVAMFLGFDGVEPFIIHDVNGLSYRQPDATYYTGTLNGVFVTPLLPLHLNADTTYLDRIYTIKSLR